MSISAAIVCPDLELTPAARVSLDALAGAGVKLAHAEPSLDALLDCGCDASSVWVLTSSPMWLDVARELGLYSCLVLSDGVATAEGAKADVVAHGWVEVSAELLDDYVRSGGNVREGALCRVLVVCGSPETSSPELVGALASEADYVIACDAGAELCREAAVAPHAFVGDADSVGEGTLVWVHAVVSRFISFPSEKYATDLALAIDVARHEAARREARLELTLTCAAGGRPDHALAVLGQLLAARDASPRIVEDGFELRVLSPDGAAVWQLGESAEEHTFSLVPLLPDTVVSEQGMRWELIERVLPALGDEGISNVVATPDATVTCHAGALAAYLLH